MNKSLFGCSYTDVWASPSDWKTSTSLKKSWYVQYNFFDPLFQDKYPNGKPIRKKLNKLKTIHERRAAVKLYLEELPKILEDSFNPITKKYMVPKVEPKPDPEKLGPDMPAEKAINEAWEKIREAAIQGLPEEEREKAKPFDDVRGAKNRFVKALQALRYSDKPIKDLSLSDIKETITQAKITDGYYNKFLSYMGKIYTELIEYGCVEHNPFKLYKKKKSIRKQREVLTDEEFEKVMNYLKGAHYGFYRYANIFHQSGARSTELMMVRKKDVNIKQQEYRVLIKKGNAYVEEIKVIMLDVLPLWQELLKECSSEKNYLFSEWLRPGPVPIAPRQITRKWNKYIKVRYNDLYNENITADFYALKHHFLDKLDEQQHNKSTINVAQAHASHRSPTITNSVYLVKKKQREREILKQIKIQ